MTPESDNIVPLDAAQPDAAAPRLDENIVLFTRLLRAIGMKPGPASSIDAIDAVREAGICDKRHFFAALSACLVKRPEDRTAFRQAFFLFWRNPRFQERIRELLLPQIRAEADGEGFDGGEELLQRLRDAMGDEGWSPDDDGSERIEIDSTATASERERIRDMDFRMMGLEELRAAERAIRALAPVLPRRRSRRLAPDSAGHRIDMRLSMRAARRTGGVVVPMSSSRRTEARPVVILLDISASMEPYTRPVLHFMHTVAQAHRPVHSFVFGTRLTNITRQLGQRDIDDALADASGAVADWSGGTRIRDSLARFNSDWSRRVLSGSPQVLLVTDGLEREHDETLSGEIERLQKSCHRLIWLNPLLRFDAFEPKVISIRRMLPHVDAFLPIHSLASMEDVVRVLAGNVPEGRGMDAGTAIRNIG